METVKKILIIEDDCTTRTIISDILTQNGYVVESSMLLREAAALLDTKPFDLIISDIGLPDGNGLDFCGQHRHTPFISMSASDSAGAAIAGGAVAFFEKPFNIEDMLAAVKRCIG